MGGLAQGSGVALTSASVIAFHTLSWFGTFQVQARFSLVSKAPILWHMHKRESYRAGSWLLLKAAASSSHPSGMSIWAPWIPFLSKSLTVLPAHLAMRIGKPQVSVLT